jgi:serine/threonine-protein kinase
MVNHAVGQDTVVDQMLGHYRISEKIGAGGMGEVFRARDEHLARDVAIKVLPPGTLTDESARKHFRKEALTLSQLNHPSIATIHDFDTQQGVDFLVMEYIPGITLSEKVAAGALPEKEVLRLGVQLAEGLAAAHDQGVIHRDLKPGNLRITSDGRLKILDFGLAKLRVPVMASAATESLSETQAMAGTLPYMAPEQLLGEEVDARTDIHGAGFVLYEMATGQRPFAEVQSGQLIGALMRKPPIPPTMLNPRLSVELERIINKCVEKDPENRYQSAKELAVDLRRLLTPSVVKASEVPLKLPSIAVLPFLNISHDPANEYFGDGLAEELINALTQIRDLRVVARTSAFYFKGKDADIREVGKKLNVENVLEGSVRTAGNQLRVTVQLINVEDGYHVWSERFDRTIDNIFAIQDEISLAIVDKLKVKLLKQEKDRLIKRRTQDRDAYELYLRGRYHLNKRTETDLLKSLELFQQALAKDRQFAAAHAGLADAYVALGWHNYRPGEFAYTRGKREALKALEIDNSVGEAHASIALIKQLYEWDWPGAEREYQQALMLSPSDAEARHQYSHLLALLGRYDESIAEMKRALDIEPLSVVINSCLGQDLYYARRFDEAIQQHLRAIEMDPRQPYPHFHLGYDYHQKGRFKEAISEFQTAIELSGDIARAKGGQGQAYAQSHNEDMARGLIEQLESGWESRYVATYIAQIFVGLGQKDEAFEWLDRAYEGRHSYLIYLSDPMWDTLRPDPRFAALQKKMRLDL